MKDKTKPCSRLVHSSRGFIAKNRGKKEREKRIFTAAIRQIGHMYQKDNGGGTNLQIKG